MEDLGLLVSQEYEGSSIAWKCAEGAKVKEGDIVATISSDDHDRRNIRATHDGTIHSLNFQTGDRLRGTPPFKVATIRHCLHEMTLGILCVVCGAKVSKTEDDGQDRRKVTFKGGSTLSLSKSEAKKLHAQKSNRLLSSRRIALVMDLDHTLVHATGDPQVAAAYGKRGDVHKVVFNTWMPGAIPGSVKSVETAHWIKTRPGVNHFLKEMSRFCELSIYTHGTREYAEAVVKILDPTGKLVGGRIVTRTDCPDLKGEKRLSRLFPGGRDLALILDDREDVWRGQLDHHILVRPYKFFYHTNEVNNHAGALPGVSPAILNAPRPPPPEALFEHAVKGKEIDTQQEKTEDAEEGKAVSEEGENSSKTVAPPSSEEVKMEGMEISPANENQIKEENQGKEAEDKTDAKQEAKIETATGEARSSQGGKEETLTTETENNEREKAAAFKKGPNAKEKKKDRIAPLVKENDPQLHRVALLLKKTHAEFFSSSSWAGHAGKSLSTVREKVLKNVIMVFSGVVPVGTPMAQRDANPLWRLARALGATVSPELELGRTTHLVATRPDTAKARQAAEMPGVFVVHVDWLAFSIWHSQRENETHFLLAPVKDAPCPDEGKADETEITNSNDEDSVACCIESSNSEDDKKAAEQVECNGISDKSSDQPVKQRKFVRPRKRKREPSQINESDLKTSEKELIVTPDVTSSEDQDHPQGEKTANRTVKSSDETSSSDDSFLAEFEKDCEKYFADDFI